MSSGAQASGEKGCEAAQRAEFEMEIGCAYSCSGRTWFERYILNVWVRGGDGRYVAGDDTVKVLEREVHISRTKRYVTMKFSVPVGAVLKVFDTGEVFYYLVTPNGLRELKAKTNKVVVAELEGPKKKYKIWYYKNEVYVDGEVIVDEEEDPLLYANVPKCCGRERPRCRLSELNTLKKYIYLVEGFRAEKAAAKNRVQKIEGGYLITLSAYSPIYYVSDEGKVYLIDAREALGELILEKRIPSEGFSEDVSDKELREIAKIIGRERPDLVLVILP